MKRAAVVLPALALLPLLHAASGPRPPAAGDRAPAPSISAAPSIDGQIVFLYYRDMERASAFYGDVLGLEKTFDEGWVRIYRTSPGASVGLVDETRGYHRTAADKPVMLSIVTSELDAWFEHLRAAGAKIVSEPAASADAPIRAFIVEDPGGYTVEFFQWLE